MLLQVFGASLIDELEHCLVDMCMSWDEVAQLARNSFQHSALPVEQKLVWFERIEAWRRAITPEDEHEVRVRRELIEQRRCRL